MPRPSAERLAHLATLHTLDHQIAACMGRVPAGSRELVTDHDAFNYFAVRYGIDVVGAVRDTLSGRTPAQPSAKAVSNLVDLIRREQVKAVFPESSINPKLAETIASETGAS